MPGLLNPGLSHHSIQLHLVPRLLSTYMYQHVSISHYISAIVSVGSKSKL